MSAEVVGGVVADDPGLILIYVYIHVYLGLLFFLFFFFFFLGSFPCFLLLHSVCRIHVGWFLLGYAQLWIWMACCLDEGVLEYVTIVLFSLFAGGMCNMCSI